MKADKNFKTGAVLFFIVLLSMCSYLNTLSNGFVYDDESEILNNPWIRDIRHIPTIFSSHSWAFSESSTTSHYHPLKFIINMLQYYVFGTTPWGYHLTNVIVHVMATVMVFLVGRLLFSQVSGEESVVFPAIGSIFFAVHPVHTEAVAWLSAMPEITMSFFYIMSFYFYASSQERSNGRYIAASVFFFVAVLLKETAMTFPLMIIIYDYSFKKGMFSREKGIFLKRYMPLIVAMALYFLIRVYAIGRVVYVKGFIVLDTSEIIINIFVLFADYLKALFLPIDLNLLRVFRPVSSMLDTKALIAMIIVTFFIACIFMARKRNRGVFFGLLWIVVPLLPVFYIPAFTGESVFAERYLYLPSAGFVMAATFIIRSMHARLLFERITVPLLASGIVAVTVLYSIATVGRNSVWKSNYTLWADTVQKSPDSYTARINMGKAYSEAKRFNEAINEYKKAILINPSIHTAFFNAGTVYYENGMTDAAIREFRYALSLKPDSHEAHNSLGNAYYRKGLLDDAIMEYQAALMLKPGFREAQDNLAIVYSIKQALDMKKK